MSSDCNGPMSIPVKGPNHAFFPRFSTVTNNVEAEEKQLFRWHRLENTANRWNCQWSTSLSSAYDIEIYFKSLGLKLRCFCSYFSALALFSSLSLTSNDPEAVRDFVTHFILGKVWGCGSHIAATSLGSGSDTSLSLQHFRTAAKWNVFCCSLWLQKYQKL